jgi:hypothetical protein
MCLLGVSIWPISMISLLDFGMVPTVWYFSFYTNTDNASKFVAGDSRDDFVLYVRSQKYNAI